MKIYRHILLLAAASMLADALTGQTSDRLTREEYIERYAQLAVEHQADYGIPASITLAQGLLESDNGNSRLATQANNHFGIKCKSDWTGGRIYHDDDLKDECFRAYDTTEDSYQDHSVFLSTGQRYAGLFKLDPKDYKGWAHGLKAAGYATSPTYAGSLIKIIEDYELYRYDTGDFKPQTTTVPTVTERIVEGSYEYVGGVDISAYKVSLNRIGGYGIGINNNTRYIVARRGDTAAKIAQATGIGERALRRMNDLESNDTLNEGDIVYLQPKLRTYGGEQTIHVTRQGDTLRTIAQRYGIRLSSLKAMNKSYARVTRLYEGEEIKLM